MLNLQEVDLQDVLDRFIARAGRPALLDPGEEPLALVPGQWSASAWNGRLVLQAWDEHRNLVRKIIGLKEQRRDMLCLIAERFPKAQAELQIADLAAPQAATWNAGPCARRSGERSSDAFPGIPRMEDRGGQFGSEPQGEPFSASYTRGFLKLGSKGMAVIAAAPDAPGCAGIVAFGLIWLAYLRRREPGLTLGQLLFFRRAGRPSGTSHFASAASIAERSRAS